MISSPNGLYKIGLSFDPLARLRQIAPASAGLQLLTHIPTGNMRWLERYLHQAFSHHRVCGEWFKLTEEEVGLIHAIVSADGIDDLPAAVVALWTINEANEFQWGCADADLPVPGRKVRNRMIGIPTPIADALEQWAAARYSDLATEAKNAILAYMATKGIPIPSANVPL